MLDKVLDVFSHLGLAGLFAGIFLESLGVPFPGSLLVALAGFLSKQGKLNIILAWVVAMSAYLLGSTSAYLIGRHIGEPFFKRWGRYLHLSPERFDRAQEYLKKSAPGFIIGGRFIPTIGNITPYVAGISGISLVRFVAYDMIHAALWLTAFLGAGSLLGSNWQRVADGRWTSWFWVAGLLPVIYYLFRYIQLQNKKTKV